MMADKIGVQQGLENDGFFLRLMSAFPFPLACIWAEIHLEFDSFQAKKD